jgi:hypothetical protein
MTQLPPKRLHPVASRRHDDDHGEDHRPERDSRPGDPRLRWPTAAVLIATVLALACVLIFAEGDVKDALLVILGSLGTALAAALPSMLAPKGAGQ